MLKLNISQDLLLKAETKAKEMGQLRNSITRGAGNLAGFVGEFLVADLIGAEVSNTYDYDLIGIDGKKIDVKTKRTNYPPQSHYECSVAAFNTKQKCDVYSFVRVKNDFSVGWVLGFYDKKSYFEDAQFHKKGDFDPDNNFVFKADCYNIRISDLKESYSDL